MSIVSVNRTFQKQQKRLVKSSMKKGFINQVHITSYTADVYYAENPQTIIKNVPVAKNIPIASVVAGQRCAVIIFDETNPADIVIHAIY